MSRAKKLLTMMEQNAEPPNADSINTALSGRLKELGIDGVFVDGVTVDYEGNITIDFRDRWKSLMSVMFYYDNAAMAVIISDDDDVVVSFDLDPLAPSNVQTPFGIYLDMQNLTWLNKSTMGAILTAGEDFEFNDEEVPSTEYDAFGNVITAPAESRTVRQGTRNMRAPIVSSLKKHNLPMKIHAALTRLPKKDRKKSLKLPAKKKRK